MRRQQHANIDAHRLLPAHAFDLALFQNAKKLGLHVQRHIANLIEEKGSVFRLLELSHMTARGPGEGSFLVAKQFGLDEFSGNGCAVQSYERATCSRASLVQRPCDQFLARSRLAEDADSGFARGHPLKLRHDTPHRVSLPDDLVLSEL